MPNKTQSSAPAASAPGDDAFDPILCTKQLLRGLRFGTLGTLLADGAPFASLVNVAAAVDGTPVTLVSRLAVHTQNLLRDPRVSLLLAQPAAADGSDDPSSHPRVSLTGHAEITTDDGDRRRFLARHPHARAYADFADFAFYRLVPTGLHLVAGFGRITALQPADVLSDAGLAAQLAAIEAGAVAHMNEDHVEALGLYATVLAGAAPGPWRAVGLDAEGIDLSDGARTARAWYPAPLTDAAQLRPALVALAARARAESGGAA